MVTEWGMSDTLGAIHYDNPKRSRFLDIPIGPERGAYAEDTARLIDAEVKRIMTDAHSEARRLLTEKRDLLETRDAPAARHRSDGRRRAARAARRARTGAACGGVHRDDTAAARNSLIDTDLSLDVAHVEAYRRNRYSDPVLCPARRKPMRSHSPKATRARGHRSTSRPGHSRFPR